MSSTNVPDLKELLAGGQLPALPQSAIRLLELSQDPDNGPAEYTVPIESDPGLTGQVLRFVNSSYFGFSREISSVKLAITLVGVRTIKNFALWSAVFSLMPNPRCGPFDLKSLWKDSLRRALFARAMGNVLGVADAEDLFAAALLQDMAVPLLAKDLPAEYTELLNGRNGGAVRLSDLERERFGWTHADAGAMMARGWSLPDEFAQLVGAHTKTDEVFAAGADPRALSVGLSALLPTAGDEHWHERELFNSIFDRVSPSTAPSLVQLMEQIDNEFEEFAPVLKLSAPAKSLAEWVADELEPVVA